MIGQLGKSWMLLIRVIWKVGMKLKKTKLKKYILGRLGRSIILLKYICCVIWCLHIQIHTLFAVGPQRKRK